MNALQNRVQLIGNVGMDPEVKEISTGKSLAKLSIATNESFKNHKGELVKDTQWHNCVAWGKTADVISKFVTKGKHIAVEGKLVNRSYETSEGDKRYITEVVVSEVMFLDKK